MLWLTKDQRSPRLRHINRFDPRFWTVDFARPMMAGLTLTAPDAMRVDTVFYQRSDLAGLIWWSEDTIDHPFLAYQTRRDYSGARLSFRWRSHNIRALDAVNGPTLTIEGRDAAGASRTWFVRLWNYRTSGTPTDAFIDLNFSSLHAGFSQTPAGEAVYPGDIDRIFVSLIADDFAPGDTTPLNGGDGVDGWVEVSDIQVDGEVALAIGDSWVRPHPYRGATGYDDHYNLTPERVMRNFEQLGYRERITLYEGMSHYMRLVYNAAEDRFVVDTARPINSAAQRWHAAFFALAIERDYSVIVSLSYEIFNDYIPDAWRQRAHDGSPALTGWEPPSSLIAPTNQQALDYLRDVFFAFGDLANAADQPPIFQIGEPWWWAAPGDATSPAFYDATTRALYTAETGRSVPAHHQSVTEAISADQQLYLDWLADKLAQSTGYLRDAIRARYPGATVGILFFTPQVLREDAPMLGTVNLPQGWVSPAYDYFQLEDYDHVIEGHWSAHLAGLAFSEDFLGYPRSLVDYFAGFVLNPEDRAIWQPIDRAVRDGELLGYRDVFIWALPQIMRDGVIIHPLDEDDMSGFHEVRLPDDISFGSSGGPGYSTEIIDTAAGFEFRNQAWSEARCSFELGSGIKSEARLADLVAFFRARAGRAFGFRFKDWSDFRSSVDAGPPTATDQSLGVGDGINRDFALIKRYPGGSERRIHKPVDGSVLVAVDGIEQASGWNLDAQTGVVSFNSPPASGASISAGFEFDLPVRFAQDQLNITLTTFRAGQAPDIGVVEIRLRDMGE